MRTYLNQIPLIKIAWSQLAICLLLVFMLGLTGCNSGSLSDGLESAAAPQPAQELGGTTTAQNQTDFTQQNTQSAAGTQVASLPTSKAVAFLPVSNAPQSAVTNLAKSIRNAATTGGVPVVASVQQGARYQVKGYFSALEDGSGTLLVYVWDVLDQSNKRVYRINGQEQTSSKSADPWSSVTPAMLDRVAASTISQLKNWLNTQ